MSQQQAKDNNTSKGAWIWWVIFPPYAMYRFMRYSSMKWYIKVPVLLVLTLAIVMAVDLAVAPHRVENAMAEKAIDSYLKEKLQSESVVATERLGEGASVTSETTQLAVYYRVITEKSLYYIGLVSEDGSELLVHHVEQLFPIRQDIEGFEDRSKVDVAIWLKENEAEVGIPLKLTKDESLENRQTVLTDKGEYEFLYTNPHLYQVNDMKSKKVLMEVKQEPQLPNAISEYVNKNEDMLGSLTRVLAYELVGGVERYYLLTSEGNFMTESHPDGRIDINKRNEEKE